MTESQDQLESKESQVFLVLVGLARLVFQVYQVPRETQVCPVLLVLLGSLVPKERLVSLVTLAPQEALVLLALLVFLCRARKDCKDLQDLPEEQVLLVHRVLVVLQAAAESKERRASPELPAHQASQDRRARPAPLVSRVRLVCLEVLG